MLNKFAVVCDWPGRKVAENECILRLRYAAAKIGKECVVISSAGYVLKDFDKKSYAILGRITNNDVDFVINLHFASAKNYDGFSYIALWNPVQFYADWGYPRYSANLITHHDAITCLSEDVESHFIRQTRVHGTFHLEPRVVMSHTNAKEIPDFNVSKTKIFYCGTNWEKGQNREKGQNARGVGALKTLDDKNLIHIYGPKRGVFYSFGGYKNYKGEIPFDGTSLFKVISGYRMAICFSHKEHLKNEMVSSRIFESLAGGALPIVEETCLFAKKHFGDSLLYVDKTLKGKVVAGKIEELYNWSLQNPKEAEAKFQKAKEIMRSKFSLDGQLRVIYENHEARRALVEGQYLAKSQTEGVNLYYVKYGKEDDFSSLLKSVKTQVYKNIKISIVCGEDEEFEVPKLDGYKFDTIRANKFLMDEANFGKLFFHLFTERLQAELDEPVLFLTEGVNLFYDHISSLMKKFEDGAQIALSDHTLDRMKTVEVGNFAFQQNTSGFLTVKNTYIPLGALMFRPSALSEEALALYLRACDLLNFNKLLAVVMKEKVHRTNFSTMQLLFKKSIKQSFLKCELIQTNRYEEYQKQWRGKASSSDGVILDAANGLISEGLGSCKSGATSRSKGFKFFLKYKLSKGSYFFNKIKNN